MREAIEKNLLEILNSEFSIDLKDDCDAAIFSTGLLDSLNLVSLIIEIEKSFDVSIDPLDVSIDDFDSVKKMSDLIYKIVNS